MQSSSVAHTAAAASAAAAGIRLYVKCEVGALLSAQQASTLAAQLAEAQAAVERLTGQWQAAEAARQELIRAAGRRAEQVAAHAVERMHMQVCGCAWCYKACAIYINLPPTAWNLVTVTTGAYSFYTHYI
jgi:hypothetical protein